MAGYMSNAYATPQSPAGQHPATIPRRREGCTVDRLPVLGRLTRPHYVPRWHANPLSALVFSIEAERLPGTAEGAVQAA